MITPGVAASSDHMSRPFGIDSSCASLKFCCTRVAEVSITGDAPVTVTVSCSVATFEIGVDVGREAERDLHARRA